MSILREEVTRLAQPTTIRTGEYLLQMLDRGLDKGAMFA